MKHASRPPSCIPPLTGSPHACSSERSTVPHRVAWAKRFPGGESTAKPGRPRPVFIGNGRTVGNPRRYRLRRLPQPMSRRSQTCTIRGHPTLIVFADLAKAVRREVGDRRGALWWGVRPQTVWKWRKALAVGETTQGTSRLRSDYTEEPWAVKARAAIHTKAQHAERREDRRGEAWQAAAAALHQGDEGCPAGVTPLRKHAEADAQNGHKTRGRGRQRQDGRGAKRRTPCWEPCLTRRSAGGQGAPRLPPSAVGSCWTLTAFSESADANSQLSLPSPLHLRLCSINPGREGEQEKLHQK